MDNRTKQRKLLSLLDKRKALAEKVFSSSMSRLRDAPPNPESIFDTLGGIIIPRDSLSSVSPSLENALLILDEVGVLDAAHSHGGLYYFADPEVHVQIPSWQSRRCYVDSRINRIIKSMPSSINLLDISFSDWCVMAALIDLLRTDICTVFYNELVLHARPLARSYRIIACENALAQVCGLVLSLFPSTQLNKGFNHEVIDIYVSEPPSLSSELEQLEGELEWVRARRASDNTFSVWASIFTILSRITKPPKYSMCIGNSFGAIDLGYMLASALSINSNKASSGTCKVSGYTNMNVEQNEFHLFPEVNEAPDVIYFCDDSISSGKTLTKFEILCDSIYHNIPIKELIISYDLSHVDNDYSAALARFRRAGSATIRAPWSKSSFQRPTTVKSFDDFCQLLVSSSDEKLRWLATSQRASLELINAN
jgi:hypothetical protein